MIPLGAPRYLQTGLSPDEAISALTRAVKPGGLFSLDRPKPDEVSLRGRVRGMEFSVVQRQQYRNSFTPVVEGRVVAAEAGSQLQLRLGLHLAPALAVVAWIIGTAAFAAFASQEPTLGRSLAVFVALPLVGPLAASLAFRAGAAAVMHDLALAVTQRESSGR